MFIIYSGDATKQVMVMHLHSLSIFAIQYIPTYICPVECSGSYLVGLQSCAHQGLSKCRARLYSVYGSSGYSDCGKVNLSQPF